jgi:hypothetical protein
MTVLTLIPSEKACPELTVALSEVEGVVEREGSALTMTASNHVPVRWDRESSIQYQVLSIKNADTSEQKSNF